MIQCNFCGKDLPPTFSRYRNLSVADHEPLPESGLAVLRLCMDCSIADSNLEQACKELTTK